ncbi:phage major capsid protein (plasmid) [Microbulbifer sp. CnH-101-G]|uniref:phage major capsid protein n=1 Tax=Microbulbifer sp. CnH-101-G TaxID=3243393 RepID=UPI0040394EAC
MPTEPQALPAQLRQQDRVARRTYGIETRTLDEENRTIELALSSEYPVERYWGVEVLDHSPDSIDLARLQDGAPLLFNHKSDDYIGVVESARIDADRRVRVQVRLGKSARAQQILDDVKDGILRHVSVGYEIHDGVLDEIREDGPDVYRITRWSPYEASLVTIPADPTVGVGRSAEATNPPLPKPKSEPGERTMPAENTPPAATTTPPSEESIRAQLRQDEAARAKAIRKIGKTFKLTEDAERAIADGASVEQFIDEAQQKMDQRTQAQKGTPVTELGLSEGETQRYSLMRAINAAADKNWKNAGFELECSRAIADALGRDARGFFVPYEVQNRTMATTTAGGGGNLVGTDHMAGEFIENLKAQSVLGQLGARFLTGLVGDVDIPRLDSGAVFGWVAEGTNGNESDAVIGMLKLSPKTVTGQVPMTRRLRKQSSPAVEAMLLADMQQGSALAIDSAGIEGATNGPTGIANTTGVLTQTVATAGAPTWAETVGFRTKVRLQNALRGSVAYVIDPNVAGSWMTTSKDAGSGRFIMENERAANHQVLETTQVAINRVLFGNFADAVVGLWGVLDVMPDEAALAGSGGLVLRVFQDADVGVRHAQSFCING